jgi:ATP-dependent Clp protease ATP-binding subunit ClpC
VKQGNGEADKAIAGQITARPAFLEVYLEVDQLFYRPITADGNAREEKLAGVLLFSV